MVANTHSNVPWFHREKSNDLMVVQAAPIGGAGGSPLERMVSAAAALAQDVNAGNVRNDGSLNNKFQFEGLALRER